MKGLGQNDLGSFLYLGERANEERVYAIAIREKISDYYERKRHWVRQLKCCEGRFDSYNLTLLLFQNYILREEIK